MSWPEIALAHGFELVREAPRGQGGSGAEIVFLERTSGAELRVFVERAARDDDPPCFARIGDILVSHAGRELSESGHQLLTAVTAWLERIEPAEPREPSLVDEWLTSLSRPAVGRSLHRARRTIASTRSMGDGSHDVVVHGDELELRVTLACNERCPFCNTTEASENVLDAPGQVLAALERASEARARSIVLTGGEPTLCRDLPRWLDAAKSHALRVRVQTNGIVPGEAGYWRELRQRASARAVPDELFLSFHTRHADRVATLTGVGGSFERKVASVRQALDEGIAVELNFVISSLNADEISEFPAFVRSCFGTDVPIVFSYVSPTGHAFGKAELLPRLSSVAPALASALDSATRLGVRATVPDPCGVPPCLLPEHRGSFPWLAARHAPRPTATAIRRHGARCSGCELSDRCSGFWCAYLDDYGDDELGP